MSSKYYKDRLRKAIEQAAERLLHDSGQPTKRYLYLTKKQYESDPDGWHDVLRQRTFRHSYLKPLEKRKSLKLSCSLSGYGVGNHHTYDKLRNTVS